MPSIAKIICDINSLLSGSIPGGKLYGIASTTEREGKSLPISKEKTVSFDDSYGWQLYHKVNDIKITYSGGYGDKKNIGNLFSCSMFLFNNEKRTGLATHEIALILQSVLQTYTSYTVQPTLVILNSRAVFDSEYRGQTYPLNEYQSLMQVNYTVDIRYKSDCLNFCPEDFINN